MLSRLKHQFMAGEITNSACKIHLMLEETFYSFLVCVLAFFWLNLILKFLLLSGKQIPCIQKVFNFTFTGCLGNLSQERWEIFFFLMLGIKEERQFLLLTRRNNN